MDKNKFTLKKIVALSTAFVVVFLSAKLFSQQYYPFPTDAATWSEYCGHFETYPYPHWEYTTIRFFIDGDTTIDTKEYSKVYAYSAPTAEIDTLNANLMGGLREDSLKHIYFLPIFPNFDCICYMCSIYPFPPEYLLYSFDMDVGDTAFVGHNQCPFVVSNIDSIQIDAAYRKKYSFSSNNRYTDRYWIEGIGSSYGLFGPMCDDPFEGYVELLCYQDPYTNYSVYGYCYLWFFVSVAENQEKIVFTFFPNPAKTKLTVSMQAAERQESTLKAVNVLGQEVFNEKIAAGITKYEIDIASWQQGIYIFSLYRKGELLQMEKVVVGR